MKKIIILLLASLVMISCNKEDSPSPVIQYENVMLRVESVSSDSVLTYSPIISVDVERTNP
jgi:hypothetical protein